MSTTSRARPPPADEPKRRFTLPSAYTILFALIVVIGHRHLDHPGRPYALDDEGSPIPGTYEEVDSTPQRIVVDSLNAPINGLYGIEDPATGNVGRSTPASCSAPSTSRCSSS